MIFVRHDLPGQDFERCYLRQSHHSRGRAPSAPLCYFGIHARCTLGVVFACVRPTEFELAFRPLLLVFGEVVMVTTGQEIIENKIAHIITQSLASILVEAKMLTG